MGALSRFVAPRAVSTWAQVIQAFRGIQQALDRATDSHYVQGLAVQDIALACPGFYRVSPPAAGVRATLPRASEDNAGEALFVSIEGPLGSLTIFAPPGQTVAGATTATFSAAGLVELYSNGVNAWVLVNQLAAEAPLPATVLPGLSVLGRAPNSAGVQAPITATGAGQYLRENAAGTSLEWADPASASIINTAGQFVTAAVTGAVTIAQNGTVAAFGAAAAKSVLANATNASAVPAYLAGTAAFQHLRVNSANAGLEWSLLTSGDFGAGVVPLTALPTQASDTFLGNVSGGVASPVAVNLSSLAGAGLVLGTHTLDVTAGAGGSLVVSANDVQRAALTGAITASQDSNTTAFGALAAKSVLANATNASAVPAALAGTAAFQHLRVNSANTALEWAVLPVAAPITITGETVGFDQTAALGNNARVAVAKNSAAATGTRRQINLIEGANITITEADDSANERVNVTIAASGSALPIIQPGSFLGLQITAAGAVAAIEITGQEAQQNLRYAALSTDATAAGNTPDYPISPGQSGYIFTVGPVNLQGIANASDPQPDGRTLILCTGTSGTATIEHEAAGEATASRRFKNPSSLSIKLFNNESAIVTKSATDSRYRFLSLARARSAVQLNAGAISPAETLKFADSVNADFLPTLSVAAGVASISATLGYQTQSGFDLGVATVGPLASNLRGFPGSLCSNLAAITTVNSTARNATLGVNAGGGVPFLQSIPAVTSGNAGQAYLLYGFFSVVRGATATASNLTLDAQCAGTTRTEIPAVPIPVTLNTRYGGMMLALLHIETLGVSGTATLRAIGVSSVTATFADLAASGALVTPFTINTTVANTVSLGLTMSAPVAALQTSWNSCGIIKLWV